MFMFMFTTAQNLDSSASFPLPKLHSFRSILLLRVLVNHHPREIKFESPISVCKRKIKEEEKGKDWSTKVNWS